MVLQVKFFITVSERSKPLYLTAP